MSEVLSLREREDVEVEIIALYADLGRFAQPAISEAAEPRRQESIDRTLSEIARLEKLAHGIPVVSDRSG